MPVPLDAYRNGFVMKLWTATFPRATTPLRVRWEFTQRDSRYWIVVVRLN